MYLVDARIACSDSVAVIDANTGGSVADHGLFYSEDLVNWHRAYTADSYAGWHRVIIHYANGMFVADGNYYSYDGKKWNSTPKAIGQRLQPQNDIAYGNGTWAISFVDSASGGTMSVNFIYTSTDGINWTKRNVNHSFSNVCFTNGRLCAYSNDFDTNNNSSIYISTSDNGINWSSLTMILKAPIGDCSIIVSEKSLIISRKSTAEINALYRLEKDNSLKLLCKYGHQGMTLAGYMTEGF